MSPGPILGGSWPARGGPGWGSGRLAGKACSAGCCLRPDRRARGTRAGSASGARGSALAGPRGARGCAAPMSRRWQPVSLGRQLYCSMPPRADRQMAGLAGAGEPGGVHRGVAAARPRHHHRDGPRRRLRRRRGMASEIGASQTIAAAMRFGPQGMTTRDIYNAGRAERSPSSWATW